MADYLNPGSFTPNMDFRTNPLQGMVAGQQMSAMQQLLDRSYRDSDQGYLSTLNTYQNDLADNPVKEAARQGKMADMNIDQQMRDSGLVLGQKTADAQSKISKDQTSMQADQVEQFQRKGEFINHLSQELSANPYQATKDPYRWAGYQEDAKKQGINLPDYSPDLENAIHAKAQAYQKNVPYLQKMAEIRETGSQQRQNTAVSNQGSLAVENAGVAGRAAVAATEPGRAVEEAYRAMATDAGATPAQKKIVALDLAKKLYGPSVNSTAGQLGGLGGSEAQNAVIQKLLQGVLGDDKPAAKDAGGGGLSADDQAKVDKVVKANPNVSKDAIIKDMKAKKLIGP